MLAIKPEEKEKLNKKILLIMNKYQSYHVDNLKKNSEKFSKI